MFQGWAITEWFNAITDILYIIGGAVGLWMLNKIRTKK